REREVDVALGQNRAESVVEKGQRQGRRERRTTIGRRGGGCRELPDAGEQLAADDRFLPELEATQVAVGAAHAGDGAWLAQEPILDGVSRTHERRAPAQDVADLSGARQVVAVQVLLDVHAPHQEAPVFIDVPGAEDGGRHAAGGRDGHPGRRPSLVAQHPLVDVDREALARLAAASRAEEGEPADVHLRASLSPEIGRALAALAPDVIEVDVALAGEAQAAPDGPGGEDSGAEDDRRVGDLVRPLVEDVGVHTRVLELELRGEVDGPDTETSRALLLLPLGGARGKGAGDQGGGHQGPDRPHRRVQSVDGGGGSPGTRAVWEVEAFVPVSAGQVWR